MSLLTDLWSAAPEPDYELVARRSAPAAGRGRRAVALGLVAVLLGIGAAAATVQLRTPRPDAEAARAELIRQIEQRGARNDQLRRDNATLSAELIARQSALLPGTDAVADLPDLTRRAGVTALDGAGVVVTIADADGGDAAVSRVRDIDLQTIVNGLWLAGAEGVALNGQRLGQTTSIRTAGAAILVNYVPLAPPYRVEALGPDDLEAAYRRTEAASYTAELQRRYAIPSSIAAAEVHLPAAGDTELRFAEPERTP